MFFSTIPILHPPSTITHSPSTITHPPSPIHAHNPATDTMIGFYAILKIHHYLTHKNLIRL